MGINLIKTLCESRAAVHLVDALGSQGKGSAGKTGMNVPLKSLSSTCHRPVTT